MKTLSDPAVADSLRDRFVLAQHNQLPELYCNNTVDPGVDRYPDDQVDRCPEGAGGGNIRAYVCAPDGTVRALVLGYWRRDRWLAELAEEDHAAAIAAHARLRDAASERRDIAAQNIFIRGHEEARADSGKPIADVLRRIEDEIYTKGKIG